MRRFPTLLFVALPALLAACASSSQEGSAAAAQRSPSTTANPSGDTAEVAHIFDGDSLEVTIDGGSLVEVRLLGINAPEGSECFGDEAKRALEDRLTGTTITLVADNEESDQFGRVLRYVYVDGVNVNLAMIATGNALAIQTGHSLNETFVGNSENAAAAGIGMWAADACREGALPSLDIVDYVFDPQGRDADDPNGEWVAIANQTATSVAMDGWTLRDESTQNRFRFPDEFALDPGAEVLIHSGCGNNSPSDLYWCAPDPVWSNGGDTIVLQGPAGTVVAWDRYAGSY